MVRNMDSIGASSSYERIHNTITKSAMASASNKDRLEERVLRRRPTNNALGLELNDPAHVVQPENGEVQPVLACEGSVSSSPLHLKYEYRKYSDPLFRLPTRCFLLKNLQLRTRWPELTL